jgi:16S rRNA (cytidine1402-2'-O)-methyltransferase
MMQKSFKEQKPTLFVVSTPIGNLKDITYRAVEILSSVDAILAEDTRTSSVLLNAYQIKKPLYSYHEFNKTEKEDFFIQLLKEGKNIALISDAGTPGINDPGYEIIKAAILNDFHVVSIPGASAVLAALVTSGLVIQPFTFIGFLPKKKNDMKTTLDHYKNRIETLVIYESPNRISTTLHTLYETLGNRNISIARELTKTFETITRTTLEEAITLEHNPKGEYVIIVEGKEEIKDFSSVSIDTHYHSYLKEGLSDMDAIKKVAKDRKISKQEVYKIIKHQ